MGSVWVEIGQIRWPLAFSVAVIVALTLWSAWKLFGQDASADLRTRAWLDAILFWGGFAFVTGVLGTLLGLIVTSQAIGAAGEVSTGLLWYGIRVTMLSSAAGTLILAFAGLTWFLLQLRWRLLEAGSAEAPA